MRTIRTDLGAEEYLAVEVTERTGQSLDTATIALSIGTADQPGDWATPDVVEHDGASLVAKLLVTSDTPRIEAGYVWVKVGDNPETLPRRCDRDLVTIR